MKTRTLLPFLALAVSSTLAAAEPKPNIIVIFADDLGYGDIGPFGSTKNRTPHLDQLAKEGLRLTSFYAAPACTPSRAQLLTGSYARRVSLPAVIGPASTIGLSKNERTVAELLREQGYATKAIGKWHVGDHGEFLPTAHGFDEYFGLPYSNDMTGNPNAAGRRKRVPPLPLLRNAEVIETVTPEGQDNLTARYTEEALKFIATHKDAPFFLYLPHTAVHVPIHPGEQFRGKSANGSYGDWVEELDWSVGRVADTVRELGLSERTLLIFTSDNGPWLLKGKDGGEAGPLRGGKGGTFEGGVREPTIAWWPGKIAPGGSTDAIAANFDLLPTFVKLAGGTLPGDRKIDGRDLTPLLFGQTKESPHEAHYFYSLSNRLEAVRSGPWKLAIARQNENLGKPAPANPEAFVPRLYNLESDIGETTDVAAQHPDVVQRLHGLIAKIDADLGTTQTPGPGVRPPGRVTNPVGLWLPGKAPTAADLATHYDTKPLDQLPLGAELDRDESPWIEGKALAISLEVEPKRPGGIILAQGGSANGYALHLREGRLLFTVRESGKPVVIASQTIPSGRFAIAARLAADGALTLAIDGRTVATGKAPGPIGTQPGEGFTLGHDTNAPVGDYGGTGAFEGTISNLKILAE